MEKETLMISRDSSLSSKPEKLAPGFVFNQSINEMIRTCSHLADGKELLPVSLQYDLFCIASVSLDSKTAVEESKRKHTTFPVPMHFLKALEAAEIKVKNEEEKVAALEKDYKIKKESYKNRKVEITEEINQLQGEKTIEAEKKIQQQEQKINEYNADLKQLEIEYKTKRDAIKNAWCHFFACCSKAEENESKDIELRMSGIRDEIRKLSSSQDKAAPVRNLTNEFMEIDKSLDQLARDYVTSNRNAEKSYEEAKKALLGLQSVYEDEEKKHYGEVKKESMAEYIRTYGCLIELHDAVETMWKKGAHSYHSKDSFDKLDQFRNKIKKTLDQLDPLLCLILWYSKSTAITAESIYKIFNEQDPKERESFLKGKASPAFINILMPEVVKVPISTLFSGEAKRSSGEVQEVKQQILKSIAR